MTQPPTTKPNGVHHLAICTADIKAQLAFFTDVLGMELVALYWMHGVKGAWHGFVKASDSCYIAFVEMPAIGEVPMEFGRTHAGNGGGVSAAGTMQHVALSTSTPTNSCWRSATASVRAASTSTAPSTTACASRCTSPALRT